jgi:hypothetical protein
VIDDNGEAGNLFGKPATIGRREYMVLVVERGATK